MSFGIIFLIIAFQVVLALIVIVVLMNYLSRELLNVAIEQFDSLKPTQNNIPLKEIVVVSHAPLNEMTSHQFKSVAARKFKDVPIHFSTDSAIKGGVMIMAGETIIDCSSRKRLEKLWSVRE